MVYEVRPAALDLWPKSKAFIEEYMRSPYQGRISVDLPSFERWFYLAIGIPQAGVLHLMHHGAIIGIAILSEVQETCWDGSQARRTLVRGVYFLPGIPRDAADRMLEAGEEWARVRGHDMIYGYVRPEFKFRAAFERYGFRRKYVVIEKEVR